MSILLIFTKYISFEEGVAIPGAKPGKKEVIYIKYCMSELVTVHKLLHIKAVIVGCLVCWSVYKLTVLVI